MQLKLLRNFILKKDYQSATVKVEEVDDKTKTNQVLLVFNVDRGAKVRINDINFYGNETVKELKLKKQMKGTKEMTKFTIHPPETTSPYGVNEKPSLKEYVNDLDFYLSQKQKNFLILISDSNYSVLQNSMIKNMQRIRKRCLSIIILWVSVMLAS